MRCVLTSASLCLTLICANSLHAASPTLSSITPRGVQRGIETEVAFSGARLADAEEILFYEPGITVTKIVPNGANQVKVTLKVAADCQLGEHTATVRTKSGLSEYRTFFVGALPDVAEKEPNSDFALPQPISLNVTVTGIVQSEDVDYYILDAKKGQRICAEVEGMRLGTALFDPYVAILNARRFEMSADDDTPLVKQDAVASTVAPEDGKYIIEVRESAYGGNGSCGYRLHVGTFPRPKAVYPAGGKLGEEIEVTYLGDPTGLIEQKVKVPSQHIEEYGLFAQDAGGIAPSPNAFRTYEHGNAFEVEPNDDIAQATPVAFPAAFNGIIEKPGDIDVFKFTAKKGQVFDIECFARRIRSALDPVMNLYYADGRSIAGNDDSRGPDSYFRFSVPADGDYCLRVTDHLGRGGPDFVFRIEFHTPKQSLSLGIPRVARYSQSRQQIVVPRGNRFASLISASRGNFGGDLLLDPKDMPAGITIHAKEMPTWTNVMPVVFEAAADAPISGKLVDFTAKHADPKIAIRGGFENRADFIIGAPGQSLYVWKDVNRLPIAVVDEVPFTLLIEQPKVPIVRDGSMQLKIKVIKKAGWDEAINIEFPYRPPGIGAASSVNIAKGQSEVLYPLSANGGARVGSHPMYVIGSANVDGTVWIASQLANLDIAEPYVGFALQRSDVEQGKETEIVCTITQTTPFEGPAKVELLGLPNRVTTEVAQMTKDTKELIFKIKTDEKSPAGTHKNIFCRITVTQT
ncbi:MAG: pre-peptidase C-terminal domain-containing protein, partial [Planctomycetota bacterium]|nr:pre-peptidase C-terminal domain-containing protein [Planctomycetota bacterium]